MDTPTQEEAIGSGASVEGADLFSAKASVSSAARTGRPAPVADGIPPASRLPRIAILLVVLMVLGAVATAVLLSRYFDLNSG
jgi:hypothetical protein